MSIKKWLLLCVSLLLMSSCSGFHPFDNKISSTSDGSYVVQTNETDVQLLEQGYVVVYRFQTVPNLVAVKKVDVGNSNSPIQLSSDINTLLLENIRNRPISNTVSTYADPSDSCYRAYCEAGFETAFQILSDKQISLNKVPIAIVDSGVLPATSAIASQLISSENVSGNLDPKTWSTHATMIASLFSGIMDHDDLSPTDTYAPNAQIHSVKITFEGDPEEDRKDYGSMQLAVALDKAVSSGSKIVNLSLSYVSRPDDNIVMAEEIVMAAAAKKGVIFVVAAGNDNENLDTNPIYPASYNMNNLIVVGSHDENLQKSVSSNYGNAVDISAQGAFVYVNDKNGNIAVSGGTSFAVPLVISAFSLYFGVNPSADINKAIGDVFSSSNSYYNNKKNIPISHYGRVDCKALADILVR